MQQYKKEVLWRKNQDFAHCPLFLVIERANFYWHKTRHTRLVDTFICQNACTIGINDASHLPRLDSPRTKFPRLRISTQSQLEGTKVQCIYTKHPNHSWRNDYDRRYTENTLTALYTTDQQHVLICSTYLSRNNHRRRGRLCTTECGVSLSAINLN